MNRLQPSGPAQGHTGGGDREREGGRGGGREGGRRVLGREEDTGGRR